MKNLKLTFIFLLLILAQTVVAQQQDRLAGTWAAAVEYTGKGDMPQKASLSGNSLRQVIRVSRGGDRLRLQLSNEFGSDDVEIRSIYVADALDSCDISPKTARYLSFNGKKNITIVKGKAVWSDMIDYKLKPLQRLSVTIFYGHSPIHATSHRGSRTYSYIAKGRVKPNRQFHYMEKCAHWYNIAKLSVEVPETEVKNGVAILGNSITDGRGSTTDRQNRWTDFLATALNGKVGVLNLGIGGNCVVNGGLSEPALKRFDRDILCQEGITKLIIFEGTNDIGCSPDSLAELTSRKLISAYKTLIAKAHAHGLKVYMATITPFKGNGWYSFFHEATRQTVNEWIRSSKDFDGVIDFDTLARDPSQPDRLKPEYSDDWLHLNPKGYEAMGRYAAEEIMK